MRFEDPTILYLLVLPLFAAATLLWGIWVRRRLLLAFGKKQTLEAQLVRPSPYLRAAKGIVLVLGVVGLEGRVGDRGRHVGDRGNGVGQKRICMAGAA